MEEEASTKIIQDQDQTSLEEGATKDNDQKNQAGEPSESVHSNLLEKNLTKKNKKKITKFPKNLPPSTLRTIRFFRVTTIGLFCFIYSLYLVFSNPIKPYIKTLNQALGIDAQLSSFVFSLPSLFALLAGVPSNIFLTKYGQKPSLLLYLFLLFVAFGFRFFLQQNFYFYIFGSILVGIGLPFGNNMYLVVCTEWFDSEHVSFGCCLLLNF